MTQSNTPSPHIKFLLLATTTSLLLTACGQEGRRVINIPPPPPQHHSTKIPPHPAYCPAADALYRKSDMTWAARGGWGSHTASFSKHIDNFMGAQWQGLSNGTVLCIYKGDQGDFSIALNTSRFLESPWGANWQDLHLKEPKPDAIIQKATYVINCVATDPKLCPFPSGSKVWSGKVADTPENNQFDSKVLSN